MPAPDSADPDSTDNDPAVRLLYRHPWGDVFVHACRARDPESANQRMFRLDLLQADVAALEQCSPEASDEEQSDEIEDETESGDSLPKG